MVEASEDHPITPGFERKIRVGRAYGGPALGQFEYPESFSLKEWNDLKVLTINPDVLRNAAVEAGIIPKDDDDKS